MLSETSMPEPGSASAKKKGAGEAPRVKAKNATSNSSGGSVLVGRIAQDIAPSPHRLDVVLAAGGRLQLLP